MNLDLRKEIYEFCKKIRLVDECTKIRDVVKSLTLCKEEDINTSRDRSSYGYHARQYSAQFLGFVVLDENRARFDSLLPTSIPVTENSEIDLLKRIHQKIESLNSVCVAKLVAKHPEFSLALNPYSRPSILLKNKISSTDCFPDSDVERISNAFESTPAFKHLYSLEPSAKTSDDSEEFYFCIFRKH
jgi:hypothetical protein